MADTTGSVAEWARLKALLQELAEREAGNSLGKYQPYPKQSEFHAAGGPLHIRERLLKAGNQLGKAQPVDEPVLTPTGWVAIGDLRPGDLVIAGDGSQAMVKAVYPQGRRPVFKLTFDDGASTRCCAEHLWAAKLTKRERFGSEKSAAFGVYSLDQIRQWGGDRPKPIKRAAIPTVRGVALQSRAVPVDPYLLGLLLGDGCFRGKSLRMTTADDQTVDAIKAVLVDGFALKQTKSRQHDYAISWHGAGNVNPLIGALREMGLWGRGSADKFVPDAYLFNDDAVRLAVLQGLMDTDGSVSFDGAMEFTSISKALADAVEFLARSFGGKVKRQTRTTNYTYKGEKLAGKPSIRLRIRLPHVPLFRLDRKIARCFAPVSTSDHRLLYAIDEAGDAECVCIAVDHPAHTYVTRDFIVTHNTWSAGFEHAMHVTGRYPDWWEGAVFDEAVIGWAASETGQGTRDTVQRILLGQVGSWGTGAIPRDAIKEIKRASGSVPDFVETILVRHGGGGDVQAGTSRITIKTYDQGRQRWQGETLDFVWFDEEPPEDIYFEGLTRTNARGGIVTLTFTPLKGMSAVVRRFLQEKPAGTAVVNMTINDAGHYTPEQRAAIIATYPAHEREARVNGTPTLGSGRIFPLSDDVVAEAQVAIPPHWPRICGMDFGWDHPTAAVWMAWDRDTDTVHVYDAYRVKEATPLVHSAAIKARGEWIPVAWPHDGLQHDKGSGEELAKQYAKHGVRMLKDKATHAPDKTKGQAEGEGGNGVEAGLMMMLDRMQTGRLKVARHLNDWFEEFRLYHREDGKVVKLADDLMSATRYGLMMLRHAAVPKKPQSKLLPAHRITDSATGLLG